LGFVLIDSACAIDDASRKEPWSMIEPAHGNLLTADAQALVNAVNCVGSMGKGIALQFKQAFPANFKAYEAACAAGAVMPGRMLIHDHGGLANPRWIVNFPTKRHWRDKSRLRDIASGLKALIADVRRLGIRSIAVPALGCGLGGLDWIVVRPMIEEAFSALPDVRVLLFEPSGMRIEPAMPAPR
jgi:O-acetyl-ADP-ribose deacetylase (regulator of RNase III)